MRLLSRLTDSLDSSFALVWGIFGVGIIALAFGIAALGYNDEPTVIATNTAIQLPPINVDSAVR
jgi:hypothetical protein